MEVINIELISIFYAKVYDLVLRQCCFPVNADTLLLPAGHGNSEEQILLLPPHCIHQGIQKFHPE